MKSDPHFSQLDYQDRQTIAIGLEQGLSIRAIARVLERSASTISREIARNAGGKGYSCRYAQQRQVAQASSRQTRAQARRGQRPLRIHRCTASPALVAPTNSSPPG